MKARAAAVAGLPGLGCVGQSRKGKMGPAAWQMKTPQNKVQWTATTALHWTFIMATPGVMKWAKIFIQHFFAAKVLV